MYYYYYYWLLLYSAILCSWADSLWLYGVHRMCTKTASTMVDIHNMLCKATVIHSELHANWAQWVCSEAKNSANCYSCHCEMLRAHPEMRHLTSVHTHTILCLKRGGKEDDEEEEFTFSTDVFFFFHIMSSFNSLKTNTFSAFWLIWVFL